MNINSKKTSANISFREKIKSWGKVIISTGAVLALIFNIEKVIKLFSDDFSAPEFEISGHTKVKCTDSDLTMELSGIGDCNRGTGSVARLKLYNSKELEIEITSILLKIESYSLDTSAYEIVGNVTFTKILEYCCDLNGDKNRQIKCTYLGKDDVVSIPAKEFKFITLDISSQVEGTYRARIIVHYMAPNGEASEYQYEIEEELLFYDL